MPVSNMNFLPQFAALPAKNGADAKAGQGGAFDGLLEALSAAKNLKIDPAAAPAKSAGLELLGERLARLFEALAGAKGDLRAPGLGLKPAEREKLASELEKLLHDSRHDGLDILAALLNAAQLNPTVAPEAALSLAKLLSTSSDGSVSSAAVAENVQLLTQAVELVASSNGTLTLPAALRELTNPGDAFAKELDAAISAAQSPPDTGPPKGAPPESEASASAPAGSNGRELTAVETAASPADGAAPEDKPEILQLAQALEALIASQPTKAPLPPRPERPGEGTPVPVQGSLDAQPDTGLELARQLAQMAPLAAATRRDARPAVATSAAAAPAVKASDKADTGGGGPAAPINVSTAAASTVLPLPAALADPRSRGDSRQDGKGQPKSSDLLTAAVAAGGKVNIEAPMPSSGPAPAPRAAVEQAIVEQVVQHATIALREGQTEFRIQLKPEFLGALEVRVSVDDGVAAVRISAQSSTTRQLIDANIGQLRQAFGGAAHVRVEQVPQFGSSGAPWTFNPGSQQGFWQGQNPYDGSSQLPEAIPFSGDAEPEVATAGAAPAPAAGIDFQA